MLGFLWSVTVISMWKAAFSFTSKQVDDPVQKEGYMRLVTIHSKNQWGYHTRFMSDFDIFLESMLNQEFFEGSTSYYDNKWTQKELEDMESGLNGDFSEADVRHNLKDKDPGHGTPFKCTRRPDRVGTNYAKGDALSCYKILPKGQMPHV